MEQRIIQYVSYLKGIYLKEYDDEERKKICEQVLVQIGFFQHERLIHLICHGSLLLLLAVVTFAYAQWPFCAIFWTGVSPACAADPLYQTLLYFGKFCTDDVFVVMIN